MGPSISPLLDYLLQDKVSLSLSSKKVTELANFVKYWSKVLKEEDSEREHAAFFSIGNWSHKIALMVLPLVASIGKRVVYMAESILSGPNCLIPYLNSNFKVRTELNPFQIRTLLTKNKAVIFSVPKPITAFFEKQINLSIGATTPLSKIELNLLTKYFIVLVLLSGAKRVLVDLRIGPGSLFPTPAEAKALAVSWQKAAHNFNINSCFMLINMIQPLGKSLGCPFEAVEAIQGLKGKGPLDLLKLSLECASELISPGQRIAERMEVKKLLKRKLINQQAIFKLREIVKDQGGEFSLENYSIPSSERQIDRILAENRGYVQRFNLKKLLILRARLNAKNIKANYNSSLPAGIIINPKIGDKVEKGELLAEIYFQRGVESSNWFELVKSIFVISPTPPLFRPLVIEKLKDNFQLP